MENRACNALIQTLINKRDGAFVFEFWEKVTILAQEQEVLELLRGCTTVLGEQDDKLREQILDTREDADN